MRVRPSSEPSRRAFDWGRANFLQEARTLARFDHPSIVRITRVFEANATPLLVMRFELVSAAPPPPPPFFFFFFFSPPPFFRWRVSAADGYRRAFVAAIDACLRVGTRNGHSQWRNCGKCYLAPSPARSGPTGCLRAYASPFSEARPSSGNCEGAARIASLAHDFGDGREATSWMIECASKRGSSSLFRENRRD